MDEVEAVLGDLRSLLRHYDRLTKTQIKGQLRKAIQDLHKTTSPWEEDPEAEHPSFHARIDRSAGLALNANYSGVGGNQR